MYDVKFVVRVEYDRSKNDLASELTHVEYTKSLANQLKRIKDLNGGNFFFEVKEVTVENMEYVLS